MAPGFDLLWCIARHLPKYLIRYVADAAGIGMLGDLLVDVWNDYRQRPRGAGQLRDELAALAGVNPASASYRQQVAQVTAAAAAGQPAAVRQALATYLQQLPGTVRRSLRRTADPGGTTIPPDLVLEKPQDLAPFFPLRLPRFKPGDRPLPGLPLELEELLGMGGFGEVWKAKNPQLPRLPAVALKFCLDREAARVLRNEARVLERLMSQQPHPGIVKLRQAYLQVEPPFLEYEYVEGGDLGTLIEQWHQVRGGPDPVKAARVICRLAEIVGAVHQLEPPIVHRDLKPANILVERDGRSVRFRITDFGIGGIAAGRLIQTARAGDPSLSAFARGACTPLYASPQQKEGQRPRPQDDVYALGVIWWQLLTGDLSAGAPTGLEWTRQLAARGMSPCLVKLLAACVESDPGKRPADAAILASQVHRALDTAGPSITPAPTTHAPPPLPATAPTAGNRLSSGSYPRGWLGTAVKGALNPNFFDPLAPLRAEVRDLPESPEALIAFFSKHIGGVADLNEGSLHAQGCEAALTQLKALSYADPKLKTIIADFQEQFDSNRKAASAKRMQMLWMVLGGLGFALLIFLGLIVMAVLVGATK